MAEQQPLDTTQPALSSEQKIGFTLLLVFAILSVGLGIVQIRNTMYGPLSLNNKVSPDVKDQVNSIDALRYRDTDHDGLSDYDELYVYGTSPYLYDTFSYGMSDKEVVEKGLPLCPNAGRDCNNQAAGGIGADTGSATVSSSIPSAASVLGPPPPDLASILSDPNQIRKMLLDSGTDKKFLDKVSDKDLMQLVNQLITTSSTFNNLQAINAIISSTSTTH